MTITELHNAIKQELDKTSSLELPAFENEEIDYWLNQTISMDFINQRYSGNNFKRTSVEETEKRIEDLRTLVTNSTLTSVSKSYYTNNYCFTLPSDYYLLLSDAVEISYTSDVTGSAGTKTVGSTPITTDKYTAAIRDPFSEHIFYKDYAEPLRLIQDNEIVFITDGTYIISTDSAKISYIKRPQTVSIDDVTSGNIEEGVLYDVDNSDSSYVTYNSVNYYHGDTFTGVTAVTTYTESGISTVHITIDLPKHTHQEIAKMTAAKMLENIESPRYQTIEREVQKME